jgi:hypothetical protein
VTNLAMPRFTKDNARDLSDAQVAELNERYEQSIKWLSPDLPNYNGECDHIAENVLCAYKMSSAHIRSRKYSKERWGRLEGPKTLPDAVVLGGPQWSTGIAS